MRYFSRRTFLEQSSAGAAFAGLASIPGFSSLSASATHLLKPQVQSDRFAHWSFGGVPYSSYSTTRSAQFRFWFTPTTDSRTRHFRDEVTSAVRRIDKLRKSQDVALCYSGGVDSEILALALKQQGIRTELYFLDLWGLNGAVFRDWASPSAKRLGMPLNVVSISRDQFYGHAEDLFLKFGSEAPTYLGMLYLFSQIPTNQFIVTGDGDLDRQGPLFNHIAQAKATLPMDSSQFVVFSTSSVVYENWAQANSRPGEYYFFRSTPGLVASVLKDPRFKNYFPSSSTKNLIHSVFPEIPRRSKTTNWDSMTANRENASIRRHLEGLAARTEGFTNWRRLNGTVARVNDIFKT